MPTDTDGRLGLQECGICSNGPHKVYHIGGPYPHHRCFVPENLPTEIPFRLLRRNPCKRCGGSGEEPAAAMAKEEPQP